MTTQEIANFIKTQLKMGSTRAEVERILSLNRITPQEIKASFDLAMIETGGTPPPTPPPVAPPGMTGIGMPPKIPTVPPPTTGVATPDRAFPPPAMALHSIDSVAPAPTPVKPSLPPSYFKSTPPPPPPPFRSQTPVTPQAPKRGGHWFAFLLIIIILGLGGTGAYAYMAKPAWANKLPDLSSFANLPIVNKFFNTTPTPDQALAKMFAAVSQIKSLKYDIDLAASSSLPPSYFGFMSPSSQPNGTSTATTTDAAPTDKLDASLSLKLTGQGDMTDIANANNSSNLIIGGKMVTAGMETSANLDLSFIRLDKINYFKVDRLPTLLPLPSEVGGFVGQWIKISGQDIASSSASSLVDSSQLNNLNLTKEDINTLRQELISDGAIRFGEFIGIENLDGKPTYNYTTVFSKDGLKKMIDSVGRLSEKLQNQVTTGALADQKERTVESLAKMKEGIDKINLPEGKIWLGQTDFLPYKISFDNVEIPIDSAKINLSLTTQYSNYNQPVSITAPVDTKSLQDLIGSIFGGMFGSMDIATSSSTSTTIKISATTTPAKDLPPPVNLPGLFLPKD
jgi:hypothetical protein